VINLINEVPTDRNQMPMFEVYGCKQPQVVLGVLWKVWALLDYQALSSQPCGVLVRFVLRKPTRDVVEWNSQLVFADCPSPIDVAQPIVQAYPIPLNERFMGILHTHTHTCTMRQNKKDKITKNYTEKNKDNRTVGNRVF
jgi:hypothetical protein